MGMTTFKRKKSKVTVNPKREIKKFGNEMFKAAMYLSKHHDRYITQKELVQKTGASTTALNALLGASVIMPHKGNYIGKHGKRFQMTMEHVKDFLFKGWISKTNETNYFDELLKLRNYINTLDNNGKLKEQIVHTANPVMSEMIAGLGKKQEEQNDSCKIVSNYLRAREMFMKHFNKKPEHIEADTWNILKKMV